MANDVKMKRNGTEQMTQKEAKTVQNPQPLSFRIKEISSSVSECRKKIFFDKKIGMLMQVPRPSNYTVVLLIISP